MHRIAGVPFKTRRGPQHDLFASMRESVIVLTVFAR